MSAARSATTVPVWDISEKFGDDTNLLVTNVDQGRDLAKRRRQGDSGADARSWLCRGGTLAEDAVRIAVYLPKNARVQTAAIARRHTAADLARRDRRARRSVRSRTAEMWRAWEYWARRADVAQLLGEPPESTRAKR